MPSNDPCTTNIHSHHVQDVKWCLQLMFEVLGKRLQNHIHVLKRLDIPNKDDISSHLGHKLRKIGQKHAQFPFDPNVQHCTHMK